MAPAGSVTIAIARENGSWTRLDDVEEAKRPDTRARRVLETATLAQRGERAR